MIRFKVKDNVLAHAANGGDASVFEGLGNGRCGRLQRFFLLAEPDRFDHVSGNPLGEAAGNGFDFG